MGRWRYFVISHRIAATLDGQSHIGHRSNLFVGRVASDIDSGHASNDIVLTLLL
jgi:hypothetical protein